jgi:hypothetical protein
MIKRLLFAVCFLQAVILPAQDKTNPADYTFSKGLKVQFVLQDDFSKFSNNWLLGIEENSWAESIEGGHLVFESLTNKPKEDLIPVIIDQNRSFEIETSIRLVEGQMDKGYGLQWGESSQSDEAV